MRYESRNNGDTNTMMSRFCILCKLGFQLFVLSVFFVLPCNGFANSSVVDVPILADAIRKAEGNKNYGVLSVSCKTESACRQICINSIKNNLKRYEKSDKSLSFIAFMGKRWAPVGMGRNSNDPKNLNANWVRNTTRIYERLLSSKSPKLKKFNHNANYTL